MSPLKCSRIVHHVSPSEPWGPYLSQAKLKFYKSSYYFMSSCPGPLWNSAGLEWSFANVTSITVGTSLLSPLFLLDTRWFEIGGYASQACIPSASRSAPWKRQCFCLMICVDFLLTFFFVPLAPWSCVDILILLFPTCYEYADFCLSILTSFQPLTSPLIRWQGKHSTLERLGRFGNSKFSFLWRFVTEK